MVANLNTPHAVSNCESILYDILMYTQYNRFSVKTTYRPLLEPLRTKCLSFI